MCSNKIDYQDSRAIVAWFEKNKRDLPWRNVNDPYKIWISEIILQQTRVVQGLAYYSRFIGRFPDIRSLAEAGQEEVLKYWQGLGYYSRARNLHEAAKSIQLNFGGVFPRRYDDVLSLKGIGKYTAAAIVSLAWNQPYPVIDGNVYRVLGRFFAVDVPFDTGKGKKIFEELAYLLMDAQHAGLHNQAMMELGALQCVPRSPDCYICPIKKRCLGFLSGNPQQFPVRQHKNKVRERFFNYFFIFYEGSAYLSHRSNKDIWQGLFEFPLIETSRSTNFEEICRTVEFNDLFSGTGEISFSSQTDEVKHVLTHQILYARFYQVEIQKENSFLKKYLKTPVEKINDFAVPKLIQRFLLSCPL
ncbi:MAG: A/G-specific adenine glycosylase [Tannerella sp.]|jgi:A/G-specific adenine glycosylase|nr:A/G-specific adenine glycosylase [Tannerella sp.]